MTEDQAAARRRLGKSFEVGGDRYERLRPGYPAEAVTWLLGDLPAGSRVVDVGAGTGKLTAALTARGMDVVAVDPSEDMLDQLTGRLPTVIGHVGTGEDTGRPNDSADLVTFAQSWHWVDPVAGAAEVARILTPGGSVAMVWNFVDVRVDWAAELARTWHSLSTEESVRAERHRPELGTAFSAIDQITVDWSDDMSVPDLAALVTTRSYYLTASAQEQEEIRRQVAVLLAERFADADTVALPYRTRCYRARLLG